MKEKIKIFVTGGTIDDHDYDSVEKMPKDHQTKIPQALESVRVSADYDVEVLMQKDSRLVNDDDRNIIFEKCQSLAEDKIIITHGTVSMAATAKFLGEKNINKTIVLTGSARPVNKENSDALFNLGAAVIATQLLPQGVYITMNGNIFNWDNVKKNMETGYFEEEKI